MSFAVTGRQLLSFLQSLRAEFESQVSHRRLRVHRSVARQSDVFESRAMLAATVSLSSAAGSVAEFGGSTTVTATLSEPATEDVFVQLQTSGTAISDTDYRITSGASPITIDGDFSDWHNNPGILFGTDPINDTHDTDTTGAGNTPSFVDHPDADLREFGVTHDDQNLYFYFRSEGQIGRTQVADPSQSKIAGRYYVIVTMDVDQNDVTGYQLHEGGYYPTTPGYDMNSEVEFYDGTFNTGNYLNHGATDLPTLNQAFADQSNNGYDPALAADDIQGPFTPGFLRVIPGSYDYYTQWVYKDNDPANGGNDSVTFVKDKGPVVTGIIQQQVSADGHELEMIVPYKGFLVDQSGNPIVDVGKILDLSFSLEASGELAPGNEWASDTANPLNGYELTASSAQSVDVIRIPKGQTSASVKLTATNNAVVAPNRSAVVQIASVVGATPSGVQQVSVDIVNDDRPQVQTTPSTLSYIVGSPSIVIDAGLTSAVAAGSTYTGATVSVGAGYVAGKDVLEYVDQGSITGSFDAATGILTLTGDATPGEYQSALRSVTYKNIGGRPSQRDRTITFTVASGTLNSNATRLIQLSNLEIASVDVIADSISEAAGAAATMVRVSRTDIDGPFSVPMTQSFENTAIYEIPDKSTIYSPISVPNQASGITDLNVSVNFQHDFLADLDVYLISPSGTRVKLFADILSTSTQMTGTIFDDQASASILSGTGTFTGRFLPEELLSRFNNESPVGTWLLEVTDDNTSHFGRLQGWSMTMTTMGLQAATVVIRSSDVSKAAFQGSATKTVVIPANQSEILVPLDAVDNNILDGDTEVTISAISVDVAGLGLGDDKVIVTDKETLDLAVSTSSVSEAVVPSTITGTVTRRNTDISLPYTVAISSSHPGRLSVSSATVTIPAGQSAMDFPITVHDNSIVDGDVIVTLTATVPEYGDPVTADVTVLDYEPALVLSTSTPTVAENAGTFVAKVSRLGIDDSDRSIPLIVNLSAGPGLTVPATVTIPSGLSEMTFSVGIIDNALLDGNRSSSITASKNFYTLGTLAIAITDYESVTITLNKSSFLENAGSKAAIATVRRSDTGNLGQSLLVALESSDATELRVPASITIPAGLASVTFFVEAVDDSDIDGAKSVTITASVVEYVTGTATVVVQDHEPVVLTGPNAQTTTSRPTISWNAIAGTLRYDVWIDNLSTGVSQLLRNINVPTNSYVPPENLGIGRYRVWVRAIDQLEQAGFWSAARDFYISTRPTITSPQENLPLVGGAFPTIVWSAVPDATKYELWVDNITNGRVRVIYRAGTSALSTTSYVSTEGLGSGTYQIWVRALNTKGEAGFWSAAVTTKVVASPVVLQPADEGTFDRTPTFTWTAITGATNYDVWIANSKNNDVVFRDKFVRTTSFTATKDMAFGNYQIWVRAQNGDSFGVWSAAKAFSVGLPPQITSVKTVGTPAKPRFDWTGIAGTDRYELWVNNENNVRVLHKSDLTDTTYTSPTTLAKGTYRVWIRAVSTMGEVTAWSSPVDLIIAWSELQKDSASLVYVSSKSTFSESDRQLTTGGFLNVSAEVQEPEPTALAVDEVTAAIKPPGNDTAISMNPVESAQKFAIDHDTVMSELPLADWWAEDSEPSRDNQIHSAAALATTAGLVVRRKQKSEDRRKRNRI
jgi:subtilisin-like proprotein convertase family protein